MVGRYGEIRGDDTGGRYREIQGDVGLGGQHRRVDAAQLEGRYRETQGDTGRYREIQ